MTASSPFHPIEVLDPRHIRAELIWANERVVEPTYYHLKFEVQDETSCLGIVQGELSYEMEGLEGTVKQGEWFFPGSGNPEISFQPGTRIYSIRFRLLHLEGGRIFPQPDPLPVFGAEAKQLGGSVTPLIRRLEKWPRTESLLLGRNQIPLSENLEIEADFLRWLALYSRVMRTLGQEMRPRTDRDERVMRAMDLIEQHPMSVSWSEEALASSCGVSLRHLRRLFQDNVGKSPRDLYQQRRLELARHGVGETVIPFKELAFELGFRAPPHFTHWFRKVEGMSPRDFRINPPQMDSDRHG